MIHVESFPQASYQADYRAEALTVLEKRLGTILGFLLCK